MYLKKRQRSAKIAPKPVHPRPVRIHGLFGMGFVRQHMMVDDRWTPSSLTEEFKGIADLMSKRMIFARLESQANRKNLVKESHNLKHQCRDGRAKLQLSLYGRNTMAIRNFLINHKDMQRLYQKMPVYQVIDNINQRTFVMRKERDRLKYRLNQLKSVYGHLLVQKATLENRIKYENEFVLDEEVRAKEFHKKIENSEIRLKAIKTVNGTYKKMIQILRHDAIFYEPIMISLSKDINDQAAFIKHILFMGIPAISKFKELSEEYRQKEDKNRKISQSAQQTMATWRNKFSRRSTAGIFRPPKAEDVITKVKRYVRETQSMQFMKAELEAIESTIKQVKFATLCSQSREIYPRIRSQMENNEKLKKNVEKGMMGLHVVEKKMKHAAVLEGVLVNNLSEEELLRNERIVKLKESITEEDNFELESINHMKNRSDVYVLLRFTLWNLCDILRHVDRPYRVSRINYPNSYLKLPLLKFEMLTMRACAPELYEENLDSLIYSVKRKVHVLSKAYKNMSDVETMNYLDEYHHLFLYDMDVDDIAEEKPVETVQEDLFGDNRIYMNVPSRKQIKATSMKIVEELSKKEE